MPIDTEHDVFIRRSIELSKKAVEKSNLPFGALLVRDNLILLEAENEVVTENDPTRHAELSLLSSACRAFSREILASSILYTSTEPCAMCAGAVFWANIQTVVYGCSEAALNALVSADSKDGNLGIACRDILSKHGIKIIGPIFEEEAVAVHKGFWTS
jgi:Cytosine/adenosine deaminases